MTKLILLLIGLLVIGTASALTEPFTYDSPYTETFTLAGETGYGVSSLNTCLNIDSCYDEVNYNNKACSYTYFCYAILPSNSNNIGDALQKECLDITETDKNLVIKDFVPPVGVLYYVSTFITVVDYTYNDATLEWNTPIASIPEECGGHQLIHAYDIRSVCPNNQMLGLERDPQGVPIKQKCFNAERICLDVQNTGLCTNPYPLYVLDTNGDGYWTDELASQLAANYCADRNKDKICDIVVSFWAVDVCSLYQLIEATGELQCIVLGPNGIDDAADMAALWSCLDAELSPNPWVCDSIDIEGCLRNFDPVCVGGIGGTVYPNECFAEGQGYTSADWEVGLCENPIRQCIVAEDCPTVDVCLGGVSTIQKLCLGEMCSYSGACQNVQCAINADCDVLNDNAPCAGVIATCQNEVCTLSGKCITAPTPTKFSLWDLIANIWNNFWAFIKSIFGL